MRAKRIENIRVEVSPRDPIFGVLSEDQARRACKEITAAINRHVDGVGHVTVTHDTVYFCSYCGAKWTEASADYNGGCCDDDEQYNPHPEAVDATQ